jgi:hypothetical protein
VREPLDTRFTTSSNRRLIWWALAYGSIAEFSTQSHLLQGGQRPPAALYPKPQVTVVDGSGPSAVLQAGQHIGPAPRIGGRAVLRIRVRG